jgi:tRNA (mo5U34)-methyltransferase
VTRPAETQAADAHAAVASNPFWYHTLDVAPGVVTPGWFDLRPIVHRMPWPDVRGKRCLDVGTSDGFLAFELEKRGASEVVAADLADHERWDWPAGLRARGVEYLRSAAGPEKGVGLRVAKQLLKSGVEPAHISAYDLSPEKVGEFDVVVCGSLLLHLRDPLRALAAIRSVCKESFLCTNQIDVGLTVVGRRAPLARFHGTEDTCQWWVPNPRGHRHMLAAAGFGIEGQSRPYAIPFGKGHSPLSRSPRALASKVARRMLAGNDGVPHHAVLARPAA